MGVLLAWGPYRFETGGASFEELKRKFGKRRKPHEIIGRRPVGQYLGPSDQKITLKGTVFPVSTGHGEGEIVEAMLAEAEMDASYPMISGDGRIFGTFVLESAECDESFHLGNGTPQKVRYTLEFCLDEGAAGAIWSLWP